MLAYYYLFCKGSIVELSLTLAVTASCPHAAFQVQQNRNRAAMRWNGWLGALVYPRALLCPTSPEQHLGAHYQLPIRLEFRQPCLYFLSYCPAIWFG
jgi:hypothetical protein